MLTPSESISLILKGMKPVLSAQGKEITLISADEKDIRIALRGFCGGCGCSSEYVDGLRELLSGQYPDAKIEFEMN